MRVFVTVGEEGGFAAASRKLDISPAAVTRAVIALEEMLGVTLLLRTTRNVRFTDAGRQYFEDTQVILASITEANLAASAANTEPRGTLTVTAPVLFGRMCVLPCITEYMQKYPQIKVVAHFLDRIANLVEEDMDVAVRIGHLPDSSLRAIKVGHIRRVLCASPSYLTQNGYPQHPNDLVNHSIVSSNALSPRIEWRFGLKSKKVFVRINSRLIVTGNDTALDAAVDGVGITRLLYYQVQKEVAKGSLIILLPEFEEEPWPVNVVHRIDRHGSSKVRTFIDHIASHLSISPLLSH